MSLVLDASIVLAWALEEDAGITVSAIVDNVVASGAVVPLLWRLEVANALRTAVRRKRMTLVLRDETLDDLRNWPVEVDGETDLRAWSTTLRLADRYGLTPYDACYLEVADRLGLPLATLDADLARAAASAGVPLAV